MPIMEDKFVINIGRQLGSGGKAVGEAVARRLGIGVYDKQLINLAAEQSGLCPEVFERVDEKESRNLFSTLVAYLRSPFVGSEYAGSNVLSNDALFKIQSDVIRDIAARESCVFVGRCADYILRDHPRAVNVFVAGPTVPTVASGSAASAALRRGGRGPDGSGGCAARGVLQLLQQRYVGHGFDLPPLRRFVRAGDRRHGGFRAGVRGAQTGCEARGDLIVNTVNL